MPLKIDDRSVSRIDDRALHRQLADLIRAAITRGELRQGESLPSEGELVAMTRLSKATIRDALALLTVDGLIEKRAGAVSRVAVPPPVRHMATRRYAAELELLRTLQPGQDHPASSAFTDEHGIDWTAYSVQADYHEDTAGPDDARRLELAVGEPVLRRQLIKVVHGSPVQIQDSVMPLELVVGTPVADPDRQPWPGGTIAELWSIGWVVTAVLEEARARTPTTAERRLLEMAAPGPVFEVLRVFAGRPRDDDDDDQPIEASVVVCPAPGMVLRWETRLD